MTAGARDHHRGRAPTPAPGHVPVMLREVLEVLAPRKGAIYVDATLGAGGYSRALLEAAECTVWALDRDPVAIARGQDLAARYPGRLTLIEGCFGDMDRLIEARGCTAVDGVAFDLGVSSQQLDQAERGFSFQHDGPLDMRMSGPQGAPQPSAAEAVNGLNERELADIIWRYGEERQAHRIAKAIVAARRERAITRTGELAEIVRRVVRRGSTGRDPATRTFQAIRIHVNDEIGELRRGLGAAERLLAPGGCLAVVSFHSLEDREVKTFLRGRSGTTAGTSRHLPEPARTSPQPTFEASAGSARKPSPEECRANPRARSARLRAAWRTAAPAWPSPPKELSP
jgi:16S rRNA (cytosine1402-N4)-methyltransferase